MTRKKQIRPGEKVGLRLTQAERTFLLNSMHGLTEAIRDVVRATPATQPVMLMLGDLGDLAGQVVAAINSTEDKKLRGKLNRLHAKIDALLDRQQEASEEGGQSIVLETILDLLVSEPPAILPMPAKSKKDEDQYPLKLTEKQREALIHATRLRRGLKNKIGQVPEGSQTIRFTKKELEETVSEVETAVRFAPSAFKEQLVAVYGKLEDLRDALEDEPVKRNRKRIKTTGSIFQLKVTLKRSEPPIWRRFEVTDITLGALHDVLQVVMGWENSHMHQFIVNGTYYGQATPDDLDLDVEDEDGILLSQIFTDRKKPRIVYEYDFGDNWEHEIVLEKRLEPEPSFKYPRCVEGGRACPPEDCGGVGIYAKFVEAISDPRHPNHREMKEWIGVKFDPEKFSVDKVNKEVKRLT
jgi:hypothetical protein